MTIWKKYPNALRLGRFCVEWNLTDTCVPHVALKWYRLNSLARFWFQRRQEAWQRPWWWERPLEWLSPRFTSTPRPSNDSSTQPSNDPLPILGWWLPVILVLIGVAYSLLSPYVMLVWWLIFG